MISEVVCGRLNLLPSSVLECTPKRMSLSTPGVILLSQEQCDNLCLKYHKGEGQRCPAGGCWRKARLAQHLSWKGPRRARVEAPSLNLLPNLAQEWHPLPPLPEASFCSCSWRIPSPQGRGRVPGPGVIALLWGYHGSNEVPPTPVLCCCGLLKGKASYLVAGVQSRQQHERPSTRHI